MPRVILQLKNGKIESLKCKSEERAQEIYLSRPNAVSFNFYKDDERIPKPKKKVVEQRFPSSFEELESMMKQKGILY